MDFGAEASLEGAARRGKEPYGIEVAVRRVRAVTRRHGAVRSTRQPIPPQQAADCVVPERDGSLIPLVVTSPEAREARKGQAWLWREARLCLARGQQEATARYGATLGSVALAGAVWAPTGRAAGVGPATEVHGVGDGAPWSEPQFGEQFGRRRPCWVDCYHVSEYLAAAADRIAPADPESWRHRPQGRLLKNKAGPGLKALAGHLESEGAAETPVRAAHRYLTERREQLDYAGARARALPIGSGGLESGPRHGVQQRVHRAGAWGQRGRSHPLPAR
ncbi:MAG: ISKra4 family transposase, partial [Chloroflexota bacterium]